MNIGIVSGYFALGISHVGHLDLIRGALKGNDALAVIVNNNEQTTQKYGFVPVDAQVRCDIIERLNTDVGDDVISAFISIDKDESVARSIERVVNYYKPFNPKRFTFYNGGDRSSQNANSKELEACQRLGVEVVYLDQPKVGSSSELIEKIQDHALSPIYELMGKCNKEFFEHKTMEFFRSQYEQDLKPGDIGYL